MRSANKVGGCEETKNDAIKRWWERNAREQRRRSESGAKEGQGKGKVGSGREVKC